MDSGFMDFVKKTFENETCEDFDTSKLRYSGTGYNYGYALTETFSFGYDLSNRKNAIIMLNKIKENPNSSEIEQNITLVMFHERYNDCDRPIAISCDSDFYHHCIVDNLEEMKDHLLKLVDGQEISTKTGVKYSLRREISEPILK